MQSLPDKSKWPLVFVADDGRNLSEQVLTSFQEDILRERTYVIVLALQPSLTQVVRCTKLRAFEYLSPPLEPTRLLALSSKVRKLTDFKASAAQPTTVPETDSIPLIGQSAVMIELMKQVVKLAPQPGLHLFLAGETGTGKELIARQIHEKPSSRSYTDVSVRANSSRSQRSSAGCAGVAKKKSSVCSSSFDSDKAGDFSTP